jgi:hypothetical protein
MYSAQIKIPSENAAPPAVGRQAEHAIQQYIHQALALVTAEFFARATHFDNATHRLPHLMTEVSCLGTEQLRTAFAMTLEAKLCCASESGFSVDYSFCSEPEGRVLATWRSLHIFYDFETECPLTLENLPTTPGNRVKSPQAQYSPGPRPFPSVIQASSSTPEQTR